MCFLLRSVDVTLRVAAIATKHKTKSLRISLLKHPHHCHSAESKHQLWLQDFVCQGIPKRDFYEFRTSVGETGETRGFSCHNSEWNCQPFRAISAMELTFLPRHSVGARAIGGLGFGV